MSDYTSIELNYSQLDTEIFISHLDEMGFEGIIENDDNKIEAFLPSDQFKNLEIAKGIEQLKKEFSFEYSIKTIPEQNWNAEWESSFEPVLIEDKIRIRADFHEPSPKNVFDIVIEPKMSFGTGHHGTTYLMSKILLDLDIKDKTVLDAGSGTGILSIISEKLGAKKTIGFDIEEWAYNNSLENAELNKSEKIEFYKSDASALPFGEKDFDIILANITKGILKEDIPVYLNYLKGNGTLVISGFFENDIPEMEQFLIDNNLIIEAKAVKNNWACIKSKYMV
jgi:ribosomal protein L11 methyltransferase